MLKTRDKAVDRLETAGAGAATGRQLRLLTKFSTAPCVSRVTRHAFPARRSPMHRAAPSFGRRHFLASAAVGVIAAGLPLTSANAATVPPPSSPSAETVTPAASTPAPASTT